MLITVLFSKMSTDNNSRLQNYFDFSLNIDENGNNSHFFFNRSGKIGLNKDYELNIQNVSNDNYLKYII